ncbi:RNA polymerase sigma factor [Streptomyces sp. NPDC001635]
MSTATWPTCSAVGAPHRSWERLLRSSSPRQWRGPDHARAAGLHSTEASQHFSDATRDIVDLYHHRRLHFVRLALLLVDDLPTAEDVVQDAFTAMFRHHGGTLASLDHPDAYLRTSVVNGARSVLRRRRTVRAHVPERAVDVPPVDENVLLKEEHREVLEALHLLTRRQREVLVLRYWSHLTEAQIAETLGLSRGAVKSTASRALIALGRKLEARR